MTPTRSGAACAAPYHLQRSFCIYHCHLRIDCCGGIIGRGVRVHVNVCTQETGVTIASHVLEHDMTLIHGKKAADDDDDDDESVVSRGEPQVQVDHDDKEAAAAAARQQVKCHRCEVGGKTEYCAINAPRWQVGTRISFESHFYTKNDHHFIKTGSGQT